ncbi:response regulator transcription factor [Nocardioides sp.]|uniref:response regulator transcription factor n=1 Tax=Nocardioides sp. TaxID=35761 RepID=UPI002B266644|nr:response regulator transcription factor [Nocardioides sp.]
MATPPAQPILIADDDADLREVLSAALQVEGFRTFTVSRGDAVAEAVATQRPSLLLLDLGLPAVPGLEVLKQLRRSGDLPIIIISGRDEQVDKVLGLELGADDYVTKPIHPRELVARIRNVLRRGRDRCPEPITDLGSLYVDCSSREVFVGGAEVELTAKEFDLLAFLVDHPRQVFSRQQLLEQVWGDTEYRDPATVTEHMRRLRLKIEVEDGAAGSAAGHRYVTTVRGVGYRFDAPARV